MIKDIIPWKFRQALKRRLFAHQDMHSRLANQKRAGFNPTGAIYAGAFMGDWAREHCTVWPNSPILLIKPLDGALWQINVFYVRQGSALRVSRGWR